MPDFDTPRHIKQALYDAVEIVGLLREIPGVRVQTPPGAFYVFPYIRAFGVSSKQLAIRLVTEMGVGAVHGSAFGEAGEGYLLASAEIVRGSGAAEERALAVMNSELYQHFAFFLTLDSPGDDRGVDVVGECFDSLHRLAAHEALINLLDKIGIDFQVGWIQTSNLFEARLHGSETVTEKEKPFLIYFSKVVLKISKLSIQDSASSR